MQESENALLAAITNAARACPKCHESFSGFEVDEIVSTSCSQVGQVSSTTKREYRPAMFAFCPSCGSPMTESDLPLFPNGSKSAASPQPHGRKPLFKPGKIYTMGQAVQVIGEKNRHLLTDAWRNERIVFETQGNSRLFRGEALDEWTRKMIESGQMEI